MEIEVLNRVIKTPLSLQQRLRRNRKSESIRSLVRETKLTPQDFIQPFFVLEGTRRCEPITSLPRINRLSVDNIIQEAHQAYQLGIPAILLFPVISAEQKNPLGSEALNSQGIIPTAISALKKELPDLLVIADIALDPYTSHGHDGLLNEQGEVLNDETVHTLAQWAVMLAEAGVDMVAPSDMMDGRVGQIRRSLDANNFSQVGILSYTAKYASAFYGPFREALSSAPRQGDKKSYQMDPANSREAIREALLDEQEGADILMVKPALTYLDIIAAIRQQTHLPIAAYHVSGEYAMLAAAAEKEWLDRDKALHESLLSIKRAGADIIISYAAKEMASKLR